MKNVIRKTRSRAVLFSVLAVAVLAVAIFAACTAKKPAQGAVSRQKASSAPPTSPRPII